MPDGYVTLVSGKNAVEQDNTLIVSPEDGAYVFETNLYDDSGNQVNFDSLGWAVFTIDALEENNISVQDVAENPEDYSRFAEAVGDSDNPDDDSSDTFRVDTSALGFGSVVPENGVAVFAWAQDKDTNGGAVSLAAEQHATEGNWEEADEADQQWTPVFVHTTDSDALVEPNQPVFNPDFDVGEATGEEVASPESDTTTGQTVAAPTAAPPWFAHVTEPGQFPESSTELVTADGGQALEVNVDPSDINDVSGDDDKLYIIQQFSDAVEALDNRQNETPIPLRWTDPGELEVGVRLPEESGVEKAEVSIAVEWASDRGEGRITETATETIFAGDSFQTLSIDFDDADRESHPDRNLSRVLLGVDKADPSTLSGSFPIQFEDARIKGADHEPVNLHSSISDGYAVHIKPVDPADLDRDENAVNVDAFDTVTDKRYLFEVTVWDTRQDKKVDPSKFDASEFQVGRADPTSGDESTGNQFDFTYFGSQVTGLDFADEKSRLVVLDADEIPANETTSAWYWAQIDDGTPPQDGAGYYSVVKNQFEGFAAADQLDWAGNPVRYTNETAADFAFDSHVTDLSEDADAGTSTATIASDSPVFEDLTVKLLNSTGDTVDQATAANVADGHPVDVTFDSTIPDNGAIKVESGEVTRSTQLDLGPPNVAIGELGTDLDDGTEITLPVDTLMDPDLDPAVTSAHWDITIDNVDGTVTDTIEVQDEDDNGSIEADEATIEGYQFPDNGTATVTLTAEDNDGDVGSDSVTVDVANAPPAFTSDISVASVDMISPDDENNHWEIQAGAEADLRSSADDDTPEGEIVSATMNVNATDIGRLTQDGTRLETANLSKDFNLLEALSHDLLLPSPGTYNITVTWTDDDGATATATGAIEAVNPNVDEQSNRTDARFDGDVAGDTPLAGENLSANVQAIYEGDRPDVDESLELVAPDGSVVDAVTTKSYSDATDARMAATYTLEAPVATPGTYQLRLAGTTYTGAALEDTFNRSIEVQANSAPSANLELPDREKTNGQYFAEIGENVDAQANASDADCTDDGPRCQLSYSWNLAGGAGSLAADGSSSVVTPTEASLSKASPHQVEVTVTDHLGDSFTTTVPLVVDDRLEFHNVAFEAAGDAANGDLTASGTVTNNTGVGQDALLDYVLRYSPSFALADQGASRVVDTGTVQLPTAGTFSIDFSDETAGFEKPGHYEVTLTAKEPFGRIDRPDQEPNQDGSSGSTDGFEETVSATFTEQYSPGEASGTTTVAANGKCTYGSQSGEDTTSVTLDGDRVPPHTIVYPDSGETQAGLSACGAAVSNGDTPEGGSHADVTVTAQGREVQVSTVPVTGAVTDKAPDTPDAAVTAEGACHYDGAGAEDSASVGTDGADTPDSGNVQAGAGACATAAQNGDTPSGGSYGAVGVSAAGHQAGVSTVPVTDAATDAQSGPHTASITAEGACRYNGAGAQDEAGVSVEDEKPLVPPHATEFPDSQAAQAAILACLNAAQNGDTPGGGSYLAVTVSAGGQSQTVSTVPVTDTLTGMGMP